MIISKVITCKVATRKKGKLRWPGCCSRGFRWGAGEPQKGEKEDAASITEARAGAVLVPGEGKDGATGSHLSSVSFRLGLSPGRCWPEHLLKLHSSPQKVHTCHFTLPLPTETALANSTLGYIRRKSESQDPKQMSVAHVQSSIIHSSSKAKTTLMSMDGWVDG